MSESLKLTVKENAYDFLEESLRYAELGTTDPRGWKFAIILAAQSIELLLKARLAAEHELLVLADLDRRGSRRTVGGEEAITRLARAGVVLGDEEIERLRRARRLRNEFMHFEVNATTDQLEAVFTDLFEFAHAFHIAELEGELHEHLSEDLWAAEAAMMERFRRDLVTYQGSEVVKHFPSEIIEAQFARRYLIDGRIYERIPMAAPADGAPGREGPCTDCAVVPGQYHVFDCDMERCPRCGAQLLGCGCEWEALFDDTDEDESRS